MIQSQQKAHFRLNQVGLMMEVWKNGMWCPISMIKLDQPCNAKSLISQWQVDHPDFIVTTEGF